MLLFFFRSTLQVCEGFIDSYRSSSSITHSGFVTERQAIVEEFIFRNRHRSSRGLRGPAVLEGGGRLGRIF